MHVIVISRTKQVGGMRGIIARVGTPHLEHVGVSRITMDAASLFIYIE